MVRKPILHSVWDWLCKKDTKLTIVIRETVRYVADHLSATFESPNSHETVQTYQLKPLATTEVIALNDLSAYAPAFAHSVDQILAIHHISRSRMKRPRSHGQ